MLNRLNSDKSLAMFAGRFVPIKLTTSANNPEWQAWSKEYRSKTRAIPMLFVVRADGKQLYSDSGSLPGNQLNAMLASTLAQSGRQFNDQEAKFLAGQVKLSEEALEKDDVMGAARALGTLSKLGTLGQFSSYAVSSVRADELADQLTDQVKGEMESALAKAQKDTEPFDAVLELVQYDWILQSFGKAKDTTKEKIAELKKDSRLSSLIKPAEFIVKARDSAGSTNASVKRRAETAYGSVIRKYADSRPGEVANEELKALNPNSKSLLAHSASSGSDSAVRTWKTADGKSSVKAELVSEQDQKVTLKKPDGKTVDVEIKLLSEEDRKYLKVWRELFGE